MGRGGGGGGIHGWHPHILFTWNKEPLDSTWLFCGVFNLYTPVTHGIFVLVLSHPKIYRLLRSPSYSDSRTARRRPLVEPEFEPEAILTVQTTGPPNVCSNLNSNPRQSWLSKPLRNWMSAQTGIRTRGDPDCSNHWATMSQLGTPMTLTTNL